MKRQAMRFLMAGCLAASTIFLGMLLAEKYESSPDPKARFEVQAVKLKEDKGYVWLEAHLKKSGDQEHDLKQPVRLLTADGEEHEPADTTFAGTPQTGFTEIWYKFWLDKRSLKGEMVLKMNGGTLKIKSSQPAPGVGSNKETVFKSSDWESSWLGF
ncbi:MAG: hypothetical protein V4727_02155 [Verrucomicrobiota bacterium]